MRISGWQSLALALLCGLHSARAIFEDQAGLLDWKSKHLGRVTAVAFGGGDHRGPVSAVRGTSRAVYVATRAHALARLDAKSGAIKWRQVLHASDAVDAIQLTNYGLLAISGAARNIRLWDAADGTLVWDASAALSADQAFVGVHPVGDDRVLVLLTAGATLVHLKDGVVAWRAAFPGKGGRDATSVSSSQLSVDAATLFVLAGSDVLAVDVKSGGVTTQQPAQVGAVLRKTDATGAVVAVTITPSSIVVEAVEKTGEAAESASKTTALSALGLSATAFGAVNAKLPTALVVALASGTNAYLKVTASLAVELVAEVPSEGVLVESLTEDSTLFHTTTTARGVHVASVSLLPDQSRAHWRSAFDAASFGSDVQDAFVGCPIRQKASETPRCRALLVMKDDGLVFSTNEEASDSTNDALWVREEALASITTVHWVTPAETDIEKQPLTKIPSFAEEMSMELAHAKQFVNSALSFSSTLFEKKDASEARTRKASPNAHFFGLSKYVVALTESGKLFAIRAELNTVAWSAYVGPEYKLYVTRDHPALGSGPELLLISNTSHLVWIDGDSGKQIESVQAGNEDGESWVVMPPKREHHIDEEASVRRSVALVSAKTLAVSLFPTETATSHPELEHFYFYRYDAATNALRGFVMESDGAVDGGGATATYRAREVWTVVLPRGHDVVSFSSQKEHTVVDSSVTITGDDSLLLKYLNPNLFGIATLGQEAVEGEGSDVPVLHVSLLDSVAGRVIHRSRHYHATGPVRMVQSENWLVYSFWNAKEKRTELVSLSLFDGAVGANNLNPWKRPSWSDSRSSFDPRAPFVLQKSFIFPTKIESLGATVTSRGITPQSVLVGMGTGQIFKLTRNFIDPRQPETPPSPEEQSEGLIQYSPIVSVYNRPHSMITYNQTIANIRAISTAPAELESTTLVFAHGLDHFYVRLTPAGSFDLLPSDFNYEMLILLCLGFIAATVLTRGLARRKALNEAWK